MKKGLALFATCGLIACHQVEQTAPAQTEEQRLEARYKAWAAQQPRPSGQIVDRIETLLTREPCIGRLGRWSRFYGYSLLPGNSVDKGIVDFHLEEAGKLGIGAGRHITAPASWVNLDDRPIQMASGDYDLKEDRIRISFCGNNVGGPQKGAINNINAYYAELERRQAAHAGK